MKAPYDYQRGFYSAATKLGSESREKGDIHFVGIELVSLYCSAASTLSQFEEGTDNYNYVTMITNHMEKELHDLMQLVTHYDDADHPPSSYYIRKG